LLYRRRQSAGRRQRRSTWDREEASIMVADMSCEGVVVGKRERASCRGHDGGIRVDGMASSPIFHPTMRAAGYRKRRAAARERH
jgi:hypothetical protein